ncbi:xylulokinase [Pararhizobium sp.]|uniref:xylulokinase n=1 Tax=Pararhizobium sp. TaxID=1977563 RepID=UPI00271FF830|nr:xylulokinase [Pararhizobium sp.]MDO9417602.1 xylulokinase [Pararhizobium sp.]
MYLGIDLGTSGVKSILIDDDQKIVGEQSSRPLEISRPHRCWSEQDPDLWWNAVCESMDGLAAHHGRELASVKGIGLSGQMYGATVLDASDRPLRPAILWNDTRTEKQCADLEARAPDVRRIAGRKPTPGVTATKLAWLRDNEPAVFDQVAHVLLPKDYIRLLLSGDKASDMADSSGTMWMDVAARDWSDTLLDATGMQRLQMPKLHEGTEATGLLRGQLADRWGIKSRPVIAAGGGDNACGACGTGVIHDGEGTISLGTSGVLFVAMNEMRPSYDHAIETLCHSLPGVWHQMSVILSATSCVNWLSRLVKRPAADLVADLGTVLRAPSPVVFVPFLDGCWSPRSDAEIRGALIGLQHSSGDEELTRAVLQGVAFALLECADAFRATGTSIEKLLAIGGGSRSDLWLSMIATCLGVELRVPEASELGAAFGAARLGMIASTGASTAGVLRPPKINRMISPVQDLAPAYAEAYRTWLSVMPEVRRVSVAVGAA